MKNMAEPQELFAEQKMSNAKNKESLWFHSCKNLKQTKLGSIVIEIRSVVAWNSDGGDINWEDCHKETFEVMEMFYVPKFM